MNNNNLYEPPKAAEYNSYKGVSEVKVNGSIHKTNRIIAHAEMMAKIEDSFMSIALKSNRGEQQANNRKSKR